MPVDSDVIEGKDTSTSNLLTKILPLNVDDPFETQE